MLFDFLRRLFGWVDESSRKRRATDSIEQYANQKRYKKDISDINFNEPFIEMNDDTDSDIGVLTDLQCTPTISQSNGIFERKINTHPKSVSSNSKSLNKSMERKTPFLLVNCSRSNMRHFPNAESRNSRVQSDCKYQTLSRTQQLKEKSQYGELLQTLIPRRIHILENKPKEDSSEENVEIVDLDASDEPVAHSSTYQNSYKKPFTKSSAHRSIESKTKIPVANGTVTSVKDVSKFNISESKFPGTQRTMETPMGPSRVQTIFTNSLRDKLAAKSVIKRDFISQIDKRYNERIEPWFKEAEELKKMTYVLSKANRVTREAALEEQLARSMRLCEAVIDDREELEEPLLPTLTSGMLQEVESALIPRPPDQVLVEGFGLRITRKDLNTLADLNWLNDEVINFYMNLLIARSSDDKFPKVHAMNTFFYPRLLSGGHSSLKRWTRKIDIFSKDLIVVPVHLGIHWCMSIIDFRDKVIRYYDSMGSPNQKCLLALRQYLEDESMDKKKKPYDTSNWKLECAKDIPQQMNGSDCGVFSCMFAEYVCANRKITFTQQDMPYFRNKMAYEILKSKLL